jgi:hypothetical protein
MEVLVREPVQAPVTAPEMEQALAMELATQISMAFVTMPTSTVFVTALACQLAQACLLVQVLALAALSAGAGANQSSLDKKLAVIDCQFLFIQEIKRWALIQLHQICPCFIYMQRRH